MPKREEQAKALFEESTELYARGSYAEAAERLERAYELSGRAVLLFNLANAYERNGDFELAAQRLRRYLPNAPTAEQSFLRLRIATLEERLEEKRRAAAEIQELQTKIGALQAQVQKRDETISKLKAPAPKRPGLVAVYGKEIAVGAAGGIALTAGIVFAMQARQESNDLDGVCSGGLCLQDAEAKQSRRRRYAVAADVSVLLGIGALSWVTYRVAKEASRDDGVTLAIGADKDRAEVILGGHF
jgi:tetratricopeptide (TPR) repeat protein